MKFLSKKEKVVLITGGGRGIGLSIVKQFLRSDYRVATFSKSRKSVRNMKNVYDGNNRIIIERADINEPDAMRSFFQKVLTEFGRIDVYIVNAGICKDSTFSKMTLNQWEEVLFTNLVSNFTLTQLVFNQMIQQEGVKHIFFMTSLSGVEGAFGQANYSASKAGIIGFSKTLAKEGEKYNIRVNAISPAALTDMTKPVIEKLIKKCTDENILFPKYWDIGSPEDIANALLEILKSKSEITEQVISINGENILIH